MQDYSKTFDDAHKKMMLTIFYLQKMEEGGFIESNGAYKITPEGFEASMQIIESGFKVSKEDFIHCLSVREFNILPEQIPMFIEIILSIQDKGLKTVMGEIESKKKEVIKNPYFIGNGEALGEAGRFYKWIIPEDASKDEDFKFVEVPFSEYLKNLVK